MLLKVSLKMMLISPFHLPPKQKWSANSGTLPESADLSYTPYTTWNPSWSCSIPTSENISSMNSSSVSVRRLRGCFFFRR